MGEPLPHPQGVWQVHFSPNREHLLTSRSDGAVRTWTVRSATSNAMTFHHRGHKDWVLRGNQVRLAEISPNGKWIVAANESGNVRIFEIATGRTVAELDDYVSNVWALQFSEDGTSLLVQHGFQTSTSCKIWKLAAAPDGQLAPELLRTLPSSRARFARIDQEATARSKKPRGSAHDQISRQKNRNSLTEFRRISRM